MHTFMYGIFRKVVFTICLMMFVIYIFGIQPEHERERESERKREREREGDRVPQCYD